MNSFQIKKIMIGVLCIALYTHAFTAQEGQDDPRRLWSYLVSNNRVHPETRAQLIEYKRMINDKNSLDEKQPLYRIWNYYGQNIDDPHLIKTVEKFARLVASVNPYKFSLYQPKDYCLNQMTSFTIAHLADACLNDPSWHDLLTFLPKGPHLQELEKHMPRELLAIVLDCFETSERRYIFGALSTDGLGKPPRKITKRVLK